MIPALTCLLLPFIGDCSGYVRDVPSITQLTDRRDYYSGRLIEVTGRVQRLDQWTSRAAGEQEVFSVCDGECVRVYLRARSRISDGLLVTVSGEYHRTLRVGRHTYLNEIDAIDVISRE